MLYARAMQTRLLFCAWAIVASLGCKSAGPVVSLAQHFGAPYQLIPNTGAAGIGAISPRGIGYQGSGEISARFVHVEGSTVTTLYQAKRDISACGGLELVADSDGVRLDFVAGRQAAAIWPTLECTGPAELRATGESERVTLYKVEVRE